MSTVVHLKAKGRRETSVADLAAIDQAVGETFNRLAQKHGTSAVVTVAFKYILEAIATAHKKNLPVEAAWIQDLAKRFKRALRGKL